MAQFATLVSRRARSIIGLSLVVVLHCGGPTDSVSDPNEILPIPIPSADQLSEKQKRFYDEAATAVIAAPSGDGFGELGRRLLADGFAVASEPAFVNASRLAPERFDWHYYLAHVLLGAGRYAEAVDEFERALEIDSDSVAALVWLGNTRFQAAEYVQAREAFERALELHPEAASAHLGLGRTHLAEQNYEASIAALKRSLELSPDADIAHYPLAQAYRSLEQIELAQKHLALRGDREAYPVDPLMEEIRTDFGSAGVMTDRGGSAYSKGDFERAAAAFRHALKLAPDHSLAYANLGSALVQMGKLGEARDVYERALEIDPGDAAVLYSLGVVAGAENRASEAIEYFIRAIERDPQFLPAQLELGHRYAASQQLQHAALQYRKVLELEPRRAVAQWGLTTVLVRGGDWVSALEHLENAISVLPDQPAFAHALARILASAPDAELRDGRRALKILDGLIRAGMSNTDIGETLAMALAQEGNFEQAARVQSQALEAARAAGDHALIERMQAKVSHYRDRQLWLRPWDESDGIFDVPSDALPAPPRRGSFDP